MSSKYRVIISGVVRAERSREQAIEALATLFHSTREKMEALMRGQETTLKKEYDRKSAENIYQYIYDMGIECRIEKIRTTDEDVSESTDDSKNETTKQAAHESPLLRFVKVNTEYYRKQFAKFGDCSQPSFTITWHWPSFFVFFFWAMYRKLWLLAGVRFVGNLLLLLVAMPQPVYWIWLLLWPLTANYLYFRHVCRQVRVHSDKDDSIDKDDSTDKDIFSSGGVSRAAVCLGVVLLVTISFNDLFVDRLWQEYADHIEETMPLGSQQRGDRSVIENISEQDAPVKRTLLSLGLLAKTLKLLVLNSDDQEKALSTFRQELERKSFNDAWGGTIILRREAGQLVLISAGPDGEFDNDDDILQFTPVDTLLPL